MTAAESGRGGAGGGPVIHIGGLYRCCIKDVQDRFDGHSALTCMYCGASVAKDEKGVWRWTGDTFFNKAGRGR